jgi:hypothetical protein
MPDKVLPGQRVLTTWKFRYSAPLEAGKEFTSPLNKGNLTSENDQMAV